MHLRTYICKNMEEATQKIRVELGPDAIILSTLNEGDQVRVTAACEKADLPPASVSKPVEEKKYSSTETQNMICHMLTYHGVPARISEQMIEATCHLPSDALRKGVEGVLKKLINFKPITFATEHKNGGQIMLAGPVGAGKTVTLAKFAAEYIALERRVEIISCDHIKSGAFAQIKCYADALDVPLTLVKSPEELSEKLNTAEKDVIYLIDTPGVNPLDPTDVQELTNYILAAKQAPILILPAGGDPLEMNDTAETFKNIGCTRLIMTRFDATKHFGGLLSLLFKERLELAAMSCGPEIGSRLKAATAENLLTALKAYLPKMPRLMDEVQPSRPATPEIDQLPSWISAIKESKKA